MRPGGEVVIVDWPRAARGPQWLDTLLLLVNVNLFGGHDVEALICEHVAAARVAEPDTAEPGERDTAERATAEPHAAEPATGHLGAVHPDDVTGFLVGVTGYFLDAARRPGSPGLPTVRPFQAAQGRHTLDWVRRRLAG